MLKFFILALLVSAALAKPRAFWRLRQVTGGTTSGNGGSTGTATATNYPMTTYDSRWDEPIEANDAIELAKDVKDFGEAVKDEFQKVEDAADGISSNEEDLYYVAGGIENLLEELYTWGEQEHNELGERWYELMYRLIKNGIEDEGHCQKTLEVLLEAAQRQGYVKRQGMDQTLVDYWHKVIEATKEETKCIMDRYAAFKRILQSAVHKIEEARGDRPDRRSYNNGKRGQRTNMNELRAIYRSLKMRDMGSRTHDGPSNLPEVDKDDEEMGLAYTTEMQLGRIYFAYMHMHRQISMFVYALEVLLHLLENDVKDTYTETTYPVTTTSFTGTTANNGPRGTQQLSRLLQQTRDLERKLNEYSTIRRLQKFRQ